MTDREETELALQVAGIRSAFEALRDWLQEDRKEQNRRLNELESDVASIKVSLGRICSVKDERDRVAGLSNKRTVAVISASAAVLSSALTVAITQLIGG